MKHDAEAKRWFEQLDRPKRVWLIGLGILAVVVVLNALLVAVLGDTLLTVVPLLAGGVLWWWLWGRQIPADPSIRRAWYIIGGILAFGVLANLANLGGHGGGDADLSAFSDRFRPLAQEAAQPCRQMIEKMGFGLFKYRGLTWDRIAVFGMTNKDNPATSQNYSAVRRY